MKILDLYIIREFLQPFLLAVFGFIIFMFADILFLLADHIINKGVPFSIVLRMLILRLPSILVLTFPVAVLFGSLLSLSKLTANSEIIAMRTSGISFVRIISPLLIISLFFCVLAYFINEVIAPSTTYASNMIIREMFRREKVVPVTANVFVHGPNNRVYYVNYMDRTNKRMQNIMIFELSEGVFPKVITAKSGTWDGNLWFLEEVVVRKYDPQGLTIYESTLKKFSIDINENMTTFFMTHKSPNEMTYKDLNQQISLFSKSGIKSNNLLVDLYFKLSLPFASLITALIAAPLAVSFARSGQFLGFALSVLIVFTYHALLSVSKALGFNGVLHPFLAAWLPNIILGIVGAILIMRTEYG